ncbi:hypothetical protein VULLAG_LOCUS8884 [Vulpes lagopus]
MSLPQPSQATGIPLPPPPGRTGPGQADPGGGRCRVCHTQLGVSCMRLPCALRTPHTKTARFTHFLVTKQDYGESQELNIFVPEGRGSSSAAGPARRAQRGLQRPAGHTVARVPGNARPPPASKPLHKFTASEVPRRPFQKAEQHKALRKPWKSLIQQTTQHLLQAEGATHAPCGRFQGLAMADAQTSSRPQRAVVRGWQVLSGRGRHRHSRLRAPAGLQRLQLLCKNERDALPPER